MFAFGNFECAKNTFNCPSGDTRQQLAIRGNILFIMILSLLIMIILPFYYNYIKKHAIKTNLIATNDRSLNELLKLQDTDGIKELLAFGFLFNMDEYINVFYNSNYNAIGCNILADILITLHKKYNFDMKFKLKDLDDFQDTSEVYRLIEFFVDLKEKNKAKFDEIKLYYPKVDVDFQVTEPEIAQPRYSDKIKEWVTVWYNTNFSQFVKCERYLPALGKYISEETADVSTVLNTNYNSSDCVPIYLALQSLKHERKDITISIRDEDFQTKFQHIIGLLTYLRHFDNDMFSHYSKKFPRFGVSGIKSQDDITKMYNALPKEYDEFAVSQIFKSINILTESQGVTSIDKFSSTIENRLKVSVIGSSGVGKSAIANRFLHGEFAHGIDHAKTDAYHKTCTVTTDDEWSYDVTFDILDDFNANGYHKSTIRK